MKKVRFLLLGSYFLLCIVGLVYSVSLNSVPRVDITNAKKMDIPITINAAGTIHLKEYGIFPSNSADVKSIYISEGDNVTAGQTLALIKENSKSAPVFSNIGNYSNDMYNQYASALTQLLQNSDITELYGNINMQMLDEYTSIVEDGDRLTSPINGIVSKINIEENANTGIALPAVVVSDYNDVYVICKIDEDKIGQVEIGQDVTISGVGLTKKYSGTVSNISKTANAVILSGDKSNVDVTITVTNPDDSIVSGFSAECLINIGCNRDVLTVSQECILQDDNGSEYLFLYDNGIISKKYVDCTYYKNGYVGINGIDITDYIVSNPDGLKENSRVIVND